MPSPVISGQPRQTTLPLDESLLVHRSVRDCIAQGVYKRGLKTLAADLEESPGNLSVQLSDDPSRKFSTDQMELYIQKTGDKTPILYLIARYLGDEAAARDRAMAQVLEQLQQLPGLVAALGLQSPKCRTSR